MSETTQTPLTKEEIITNAIAAREQEILFYQINIDNYTTALDDISKMSAEEREAVSDFENHLRSLLITEKAEQAKSKIMLAAMQKQVSV